MPLSIVRAVLGLLLTLFVPGFALNLVIFSDADRTERIALSSVMSISIVMIMALFLDMVLGVDLTARNMSAALVIFSAIFFGVFILMRKGALWKKIILEWVRGSISRVKK